MEYVEVDECEKDLNELSDELDKFKGQHGNYLKQLQEVLSAQAKCLSLLNHQRYRLSQITPFLKKMSRIGELETREKCQKLTKDVDKQINSLDEINESLPRKNGLYLGVILGQVNLSILSKREKFAYKEEYERFKFIVTVIALVYSFFMYMFDYRALDAGFSFLMVWYYCTLTIREQILAINGSRIKGWWIAHHFISTACSGIFLIWPDGKSYRVFRSQFIAFSCCLSLVQFVQFYYQMGSLYRLRALGEMQQMTVSVEGFQSWMWRGMTALLPLLFFVYFFQFYNAYTLFWMSQESYSTEWNVPVLAMIFLVLSCGNIFTVGSVVIKKMKDKRSVSGRPDIASKYRFTGSFGHSGSNTDGSNKTD